MAEVFVSALLSALKKKAADEVLLQLGVMSGIAEKLQELERKLSAIQSKIGDAEERQGEDRVKGWLEELKDAADQADDILDEFNVDVMRLNADAANQAGMAKKVLSFFSSHNPVWFRFQIGRKLNNIIERINRIITEGDQFHFTATIQPQNRDRPPTHSYVDESTVIVRKEDEEKIVKLLLDHDNTQRVAVLPIVGMGGLGKTTLAKLVYKDKRVEEHFQRRIWVCVSDEFELVKLAKAIITSATKEKCQLSSMEWLQERLRDELSGKRYFLVLDDVWNNDSEKWNELKTLLETGKEGSKIIVTTRSDEVARIMGTIPTHYPQQLNENDSWTLFKKRAFKDRVEEPQNLVSIGKDIVKKCDGLPLALNVMGGLMHSKSQDAEWLSVKNSKMWNLRDGNKVLSVLRLSYRDLPSHLKQCFAFCAIFPKDHVMQKDMLIELWMAHGFIPSDEGQELEDKANEIFNELACRSFFQDIKKVENKFDLLYGRTTCKMHDLMHDLAQSIMRNECLSSLEHVRPKDIYKKTRHLYLHQNNASLKNFPNIRTLLMPYLSSEIIVAGDSLKSMPLRAWKLNNASITQLFNAIRFLKHLRYLDLSNTRIEALPEAVSTLFNLQTLNLSNCPGLRKLPDGMKKMSNLRHLYIDKCNNLKCLPTSMGQLRNLRTLSKYIVGNEDGRGIGELNGLNLGGKLELYNLRNVKGRADATKADLKSKRNLRSLLVRWDMDEWFRQVYHEEDVESVENAKKVLEGLRPHVDLKELTIFHYWGTSFPMWMKDSQLLPNLTKIHLESCTGCKHLPPLWQYRSLKFLYLKKMDKIQHICSGNKSNGTVHAFPSLNTLELNEMQSLEAWLEDEGTVEATLVFPCLTHLTIIRCPNLITMPKLPSFKSLEMSRTSIQLGPLHSYYIDICDSDDEKMLAPLFREEMSFRYLKSLEDLSVKVSEKDRASLLEEETRGLSTSLHYLEFKCINGLFSSLQQSSSPLGLWKNLTSLQRLAIICCDDLVYWPKEEFRGLNSLEKLCIHSCINFNGSSPMPSSFSSSGDGELLPNLKELRIVHCDGLEKLFKLPTSLISLTIANCAKLDSLMEGGLQYVTALEELSIHNCGSLTSLPDLGSLTALQNLFIANFGSLTSLPDLGSLTALQKLSILDCGSLTSLPGDLGFLTALQELYISSCGSLISLPGDLGSLTALQKLYISDCGSLTSLPGDLGSLIALQDLSISDCGSLTSLPGDLSSLTALQDLSIYNCGSLTSLPGDLGSLTALQDLSISHCESLTSLSEDLGSLIALQDLFISSCESLTSLPGDLSSLTALRNLSISYCALQPSLLEGLQQQLPGLQHVNIKGCRNLEDQYHTSEGPYSEDDSELSYFRVPSTCITFLLSFCCFRRASTV